jgi:hypothetical protein
MLKNPIFPVLLGWPNSVNISRYTKNKTKIKLGTMPKNNKSSPKTPKNS